MKFNLIEKQLSVCRFVWPVMTLVGFALLAIVYNFSNEEIKASVVLKSIVVCSFPLLIPMLYCKYRDYFADKPEIKVTQNAIEIVDDGIRIKNITYYPDKIESIRIRKVGKTTNLSNGSENEIHLKSRFGSKSFFFRLETVNELEYLIEKLTDLLGTDSKIDLNEINKN